MRKTQDRVPVSGRWFQRRRPALLASGMSEVELAAVQLRDPDGLPLREVAARLGLSESSASRVYLKARRKLSHPARRPLVPARFREVRIGAYSLHRG